MSDNKNTEAFIKLLDHYRDLADEGELDTLEHAMIAFTDVEGVVYMLGTSHSSSQDIIEMLFSCMPDEEWDVPDTLH